MTDRLSSDLPPLLLQATPALLSEWAGYGDLDGERVLVDGVDECLIPLEGEIEVYDPTLLPVVMTNGGPKTLSLDLFRAECRDRVVRVCFVHPGTPRVWRIHRAGEPMGVAFRVTVRGLTWCDGSWIDRGQGHTASRVAPALAFLDPNDNRRLPDGSRWVDAAALLAVAQEVLHGE